jgi:hypothetical protein
MKGERKLYAGLVGDMRAGVDWLIKHHPEAARGYLDAIQAHREEWGRGRPPAPIEALLRDVDERLDAELQGLLSDGVAA